MLWNRQEEETVDPPKLFLVGVKVWLMTNKHAPKKETETIPIKSVQGN